MANEVLVSATLTYADSATGIPQQTLNVSGHKVNAAGGTYIRNVATVTTTQAAIDLGAVSSLGYCVFHNCDATNYVDLYQDGVVANAFMRLLPGEWALLRLPTGAAPQAKAHTASIKLEYFIVSN